MSGIFASWKTNELRTFAHYEMNGFRVNVLLRTVDAYHRRPERLSFFPTRHSVDRHRQYFSLLRKGLVYSAGNDPNPPGICPTGRRALSQVCHFISTVKSIKSSHSGALFSCLYSICFLLFDELRIIVKTKDSNFVSGVFKSNDETIKNKEKSLHHLNSYNGDSIKTGVSITSVAFYSIRFSR